MHKNDYKKVKTKAPARAPAGESIENRPEEVKNREEFGHWEMDTVYSGQKKSTVALLVLTERKTRNENIILVPHRRAEATVQAINALERKLGAEKFGIIYKSITVDYGSEFALTDQLEQSCIKDGKRTKVYYCHPYSSWERGSNENVNGMIRRRHPKGTDFSKVTPEEIAATESWINSYPRKILGYKSAGTAIRECLRNLGLTAKGKNAQTERRNVGEIEQKRESAGGAGLTACLLYDKIHKNQAKNLLHLMLYFSHLQKN